MKKNARIIVFLLCSLVLLTACSKQVEEKDTHQKTTISNMENPADAIQFISKAFQDYPILCLGEGAHASQASHRFFKEMLLSNEIQNSVDVIIVEFANAEYQSVLDDYIFGKDISYDELSVVWRNTSLGANTPWENPVYFELLKLIREVNLSRPLDKKIRVLGGDPPTDWGSVEENGVLISRRNSYPSKLAVDQAFVKNKRVLILFGGAHLPKLQNNIKGKEAHMITTLIQDKQPGSVLTIDFLRPADLGISNRIDELEEGMIYQTNGHWIGEISAELFFPTIFFSDGSGKAVLYEGYQVKDIFDALIYIGPLY